MPTGIKDIAAAAGVSAATVSRVLAGKSVRPAYRARVEEALRDVNYRPNLAARRLRAPETGPLGIVVPDLTNSFFAGFVRTVEDLAWAEGLRVIISDSNHDVAREKTHLQLLREERVCGLMIAPVSRLGADEMTGLPTVLFDRSGGDEPCDTVMLDNEAAAVALTASLAKGGARSILGLFVNGRTAAARARGFIRCVEDKTIGYDVAHLPSEPDARRAAIAAAIAAAPATDGVFAVNEDVLLEAVIATGVDTARTLACFDDARWLQLRESKLHIVAQPVAEIAHAALAMLIERISGYRGEPRRIIFQGTIIER